nr:MAG TPA: hypothetical protein [Caudoviricetes sp.]
MKLNEYLEKYPNDMISLFDADANLIVRLRGRNMYTSIGDKLFDAEITKYYRNPLDRGRKVFINVRVV